MKNARHSVHTSSAPLLTAEVLRPLPPLPQGSVRLSVTPQLREKMPGMNGEKNAKKMPGIQCLPANHPLFNKLEDHNSHLPVTFEALINEALSRP